MTENTAPIRIMIVDDHEVVRQGLKTLLERRERLAVVAEAGSVQEAVREALRTEPDVIVMDVRLPDGTGVEACREIRAERPGTKVLMLTSYADEEAVFASLMAGASGYLLKQTRARELVSAIETVATGGSLLDPGVAERALQRIRAVAAGERTPEERQLETLTEQERRILPLIAQGKTNKEIANELILSDKTVKNYVSSILSKLGLTRRSQAAAFAAKQLSQQR
ncbi:MAG: response regulator transcription factor [Chloroflexota bacterium]|nr:response regulator transcription factor [Dehalococcoidia bacterium]MDW8254039.1 response regulator transcription factor [Chloroflexota bacterium]